MNRRALIVATAMAVYLVAVVAPSWRHVRGLRHGGDFATYYYATRVAAGGGDPYDTTQLESAARADRTRRHVRPLLYPPPFLGAMVWTAPLTLATAARVFFWVNQVALLVLLGVLHRWFAAPPLLLAALLITYSPAADSVRVGQANLPVLLIAALGLWRKRGEGVAAAAMAKLSPAVYLLPWLARRAWRRVGAAVLAALLLTLAVGPLVGAAPQLRYYTKVLPDLLRGREHGPDVPMSLPANHSLTRLAARFWPGPDGVVPSGAARAAAVTLLLAGFAGLLLLARRERDALGEACVAGALTVLMVVAPARTFEHHLAFLLLPLAAAGSAAVRGRLGASWWPALALCASVLALPLPIWLALCRAAAPRSSWMEASKLAAALVLCAACVTAARRAPLAARGSGEG